MDTFDFGEALARLGNGHKVQRAGWNGRGMFVVKCTGGIGRRPFGAEHVDLAPFLALKAADGSYVPWVASQADVLADDWSAVG